MDRPVGYKDAPGSGSSGCWPYAPTNYMPCNGSGFRTPTTFSSGTTTIMDTGGSGCSYGNGDVCVFHFTSMDITAPLHIMGPRPLILVSDGDITVRAPVTYDASIGSGGANCNAAQPGMAVHIGAGGGGAGYGAPGAPGGGGTGVNGGSAGMAFGSGSLEPLFPGCPGAEGGSGSGAGGGMGGLGGGGLELSAKGNAHGHGHRPRLRGRRRRRGRRRHRLGQLRWRWWRRRRRFGPPRRRLRHGRRCGVRRRWRRRRRRREHVDRAQAGHAGSGCTRGAGDSGVGAGGDGGGTSPPGAGTPAGTVIAGGGGGGGVGRTRIHSAIQSQTTTGTTIVPPAVTQ